MTRILVVGATGHFGGRICRRLLSDADVELFASSREFSRARSFADELERESGRSRVEPVSLNQSADDFTAGLGRLDPDIVIHTAGPYQGQNYRVAEACLVHRSHYIDLADSRAFVRDFRRFDRYAAENRVLMVTGASTLPGLSSAVVAEFEDQFSSIVEIRTCIAPAHRTPRGKSTISAVLSYCGEAFSVLENGTWQRRYGWQDLRRFSFPEIGGRIGGACDVPDLSLLPEAHRNLETATFHAALEAPWEQISLWLMAAIRRAGLVRSWAALVPFFASVSRLSVNLGSDRGGMSVRMAGVGADNEPIALEWILTAGRNHGPEVPCTPAIVLARKLMQGEITLRGAMPCMALFSLSEFEREIEGFDITWSHRIIRRDR